MPDSRRSARLAAACLAPALAAVALPAASVRAQAVPDVHITEYGEYVARRDLGVLPPDPDAGRTVPLVIVDAPRFVARTDRVEAKPCRGFGIRFRLSPPDPDPARTVRVTVRVTHPPMALPDGGLRAVSTYPQQVGREPGFAGYSFDEPWEMVPGTWTFAVLLGDTVLAERRFEVVVPPGANTFPPGGWKGCAALVS